MFTFFVDSRSIKKPRKKPSYKRVLISDPTDNQIFFKTPRVVKENGKKNKTTLHVGTIERGGCAARLNEWLKGVGVIQTRGGKVKKNKKNGSHCAFFFFSFLFYSFEKRTTGARAHAFDSICSDDFAR